MTRCIPKPLRICAYTQPSLILLFQPFCIVTDGPYLLTIYCLLFIALLSQDLLQASTYFYATKGPPVIRHQWPIAGGPLVVRHCVLGGLVTFLSAKTYDLRAKKNKSPWGSNLGFDCFHSIGKLCFRHSKEMVQWDSSFEHPKYKSVKFVLYQNVIFIVTCFITIIFR